MTLSTARTYLRVSVLSSIAAGALAMGWYFGPRFLDPSLLPGVELREILAGTAFGLGLGGLSGLLIGSLSAGLAVLISHPFRSARVPLIARWTLALIGSGGGLLISIGWVALLQPGFPLLIFGTVVSIILASTAVYPWAGGFASIPSHAGSLDPEGSQSPRP